MNVEHIIMVIKLDIVINKVMQLDVPLRSTQLPVEDGDGLELILANTISTDLLNYITNNAKSVYKEVGIMLDADGRVILDKSINYGKQ